MNIFTTLFARGVGVGGGDCLCPKSLRGLWTGRDAEVNSASRLKGGASVRHMRQLERIRMRGRELERIRMRGRALLSLSLSLSLSG